MNRFCILWNIDDTVDQYTYRVKNTSFSFEFGGDTPGLTFPWVYDTKSSRCLQLSISFTNWRLKHSIWNYFNSNVSNTWSSMYKIHARLEKKPYFKFELNYDTFSNRVMCLQMRILDEKWNKPDFRFEVLVGTTGVWRLLRMPFEKFKQRFRHTVSMCRAKVVRRIRLDTGQPDGYGQAVLFTCELYTCSPVNRSIQPYNCNSRVRGEIE